MYPAELYEYLSSLTSAHELAWDCGTGNGQAAVGLAAHYDKVTATDPSAEQIKHNIPHEKVIYSVERAEAVSIESNTVDLLTVANALHWFNFDEFYKEAKRVLKQNGIIAAWTYGTLSINPVIDEIIKHFHDEVLGDYWLAENRLISKSYATIPFPFNEIDSPAFVCQKTMSLDDVVGYVQTWSALQRFIVTNGVDPSIELRGKLATAWQDETTKMVTWKLILKVGRFNGIE